MQILNLSNPYQAPIYFVECCDSTQIAARNLITEETLTGTVVTASYQNKGRGRGISRLWTSKPGENLLFTVIFHYKNMSAIPPAFTLRIGLSIAEAISEFVPALEESITVKWPNDVMIDSRKVCGILAENDGRYVLAGIGININQLEFPIEISKKAVSIRQALNDLQCAAVPVLENYVLLEKILFCLQKYLSQNMNAKWNTVLQKRLYKRGECVSFIPGQADSREKIEGILEGIGLEGELLIKTNAEIRPFITGELEYQYH